MALFIRYQPMSLGGGGGGGGGISTLSVVTANGFAGSVANPTTTPAITLTTTVTGVLQGNGTTISALGYTPVNKAGDSMTGSLSVQGTGGQPIQSWKDSSGNAVASFGQDGSFGYTVPGGVFDTSVGTLTASRFVMSGDGGTFFADFSDGDGSRYLKIGYNGTDHGLFVYDYPMWLNNQFIHNLADPVDPQDAATKNYVDGKVLTLGNLTDVGTDGITVTGGTGAVIGSGTSLSQHVADASHNGYLTSTDWSTFNGKQAAGSYLTALTGDGTAAGPGSSALTLATVNSNVGTFAVATITINGKGLVTAASTGEPLVGAWSALGFS